MQNGGAAALFLQRWPPIALLIRALESRGVFLLRLLFFATASQSNSAQNLIWNGTPLLQGRRCECHQQHLNLVTNWAILI